MDINLELLTENEVIYYRKIELILSQSYQNPSFKLVHLCAQIDCGIYKTTKLIKSIYGLKFSELLILYRINYFDREIKNRIDRNEKLDITSLIKQSGVVTRSLFYANYTRVKGMSPREFHGF
jgi:AraC-like DNA-binding protein